MVYPPLRIEWANPTHHERLLHRTNLREIYYLRIFFYIFILVIFTFFSFEYSIIPMYIWIILGVIVFPWLIRPWDVILSNKRLILRSKYWNIGRFSTLVNFNLTHLDTQTITPRIKVAPLVTGFTILLNFSIPLIEFSLTGIYPIPLFGKVILLFFASLGFVSYIKTEMDQVIFFLFNPYNTISLEIGLITLILSLFLIVIGLPHRSTMEFSTTGGHRLSLNSGFPRALSSLLFSIGRKHRVRELDGWDWELPLLEDEEIKVHTRVGLINRKSQLLGLLSLFLFFESVNAVFVLIDHLSISNTVLLIINLMNLILIFFTITFAKDYRELIATNHRILFREERKIVSGIYGKRIYHYRDLPFENIQSFSYSNFSGFGNSGVVLLLILYVAGFIISFVLQSLTFGFSVVIFLIFYIFFDYRTFTRLNISSYSGNSIDLSYRLPFLMDKLSHQIEGRDWLYNKIFPNLISEEEISALGNAIRGIDTPLKNKSAISEHVVNYNNFVEEGARQIAMLEKLAPFRYAKQSIVLTILFEIIFIFYLIINLDLSYRLVLLLVSIFILVAITLRLLVLVYNSLVIYKGRIFRIEETRPARIALLFGILPRRQLTELKLNHLVMTSHQVRIQASNQKLLQNALSVILTGSLSIQIVALRLTTLGFLALLITASLFLLTLPQLIRNIFELIPRYKFIIQSKFQVLTIPNMNQINKIEGYLKEARS